MCLRLGTVLSEAEQAPLDDRPGPGHLAPALVTAAEAAVEATVGEPTRGVLRGRYSPRWPPILPYPYSETAADAITRLRNTVRDTTGRRMLPPAPSGPEVTGPVRWTRDRYGSRFAVTAPITTDDQPERWYLWDLFTACSPHRVALFVQHVYGFYVNDFADQLVALLPDWTRWLAARTGPTPDTSSWCAGAIN